jgi:hypothetical protein
MASAVCVVSIACGIQVIEPVLSDGAERNPSESDFELMRSDIRTKKATMIADRMKFTDPEAEAFWPVYRQYETELAAINDKKVSIMKEYLNHYESLNDKRAKHLAEDVFDVDHQDARPTGQVFPSAGKGAAGKDDRAMAATRASSAAPCRCSDCPGLAGH